MEARSDLVSIPLVVVVEGVVRSWLERSEVISFVR